MASALSHRQTVVPLIEATIPLWTASRAISFRLRREKGRPRSLGNWQAKALISTTISGGKSARSPAPWPFFKSGQTLFEESFSPLGDDLSRQIELRADLFVGEPRSGEEDNLGAHDIAIR